MEYQEYFNKVEEVLNTFPSYCLENYNKNKDNVKIIKKDNEDEHILGTYSDKDNCINYTVEDAIYHELFHMAFCNRDKFNTRIYENSDLYYSNGISVVYKGKDEKILQPS